METNHMIQDRLTKVMPYLAMLAVMAVFFIASPEVYAQGGAQEKVVGFFDNIKGILDAVSVVVVTIAFIFVGYQLAFAHKRFSDVAPVLIGGLVVGAAAQLASMLISN